MSFRTLGLFVSLTLVAGAAAAQPLAMAPVRVPPPLAFALLPPPPYPLDSRVAARALDLMRANAGWGSLGMNLYRWRPGDHVPPVVPFHAQSFVPVVPNDLSVYQVGLSSRAQAHSTGDAASARAAYEQRAAALRALAAPLATSADAFGVTSYMLDDGAGESAAGVAVEAPWQGSAHAGFGVCGPGYGPAWGSAQYANWPCF